MGGPFVSVVVPCCNERHFIEPCLRSLLAQEVPSANFEIVVADGQSDDGTREILSRFAEQEPRLRVIDNPARFISNGLNSAIRAATGDIIVRVDVHTEYAPDYISQCLTTLRETGADNVGGPWIARGTGYIGRAVAAAFQSPLAFGGARSHDRHYSGPVDSVYLGCWPREVFFRIGYFDEDLIRSEDDEFNLRIIRSGGVVWQSSRINSVYTPRSTLIALWRQYTQWGFWKVRVIQKHRMPASIRHVIPAGFVLVMCTRPVLALWSAWALGLWISLGVIYATCIAIASLATALRSELRLLPVLPVVFAVYHFAYGYGFLRGIWNFVVIRRSSSGEMTALTR